MDYQQVIDILGRYREELNQLGVQRLSLFGSTVRGEASGRSDVDMLVEFNRPVGLFTFFHLQHRLQEILGVEKVDLVQRGAIHPDLRDDILHEAKDVA